jgi:hypothetical protein
MAIEDAARGKRIWQADEPFSAVDITSIQIVDLDRDSIPEVLSLWRPAGSPGAVLRVFHWNRSSGRFTELAFNPAELSDTIQRYRVQGNRIVIYKRGTMADREFVVRGGEIVSVKGGGGVTPRTESGIAGEALISPTRPGPIREGQSDTSPFRTTLVILRADDGAEVARLETGSDGRFRVALPPGTYRVGPPTGTGRRLPRAGQETVTVVPGKFAHVTIHFDSGIR